MVDKKQIYSRRASVYWPIKFFGGYFCSTWPFGKVTISSDDIGISSLFNRGYRLEKSDIASIEFVKSVRKKLSILIYLGKKNGICKITLKDRRFPEWIAFFWSDNDIEKLREFNYLK